MKGVLFNTVIAWKQSDDRQDFILLTYEPFAKLSARFEVAQSIDAVITFLISSFC